jgi:hypothetical protein
MPQQTESHEENPLVPSSSINTDEFIDTIQKDPNVVNAFMVMNLEESEKFWMHTYHLLEEQKFVVLEIPKRNFPFKARSYGRIKTPVFMMIASCVFPPKWRNFLVKFNLLKDEMTEQSAISFLPVLTDQSKPYIGNSLEGISESPDTISEEKKARMFYDQRKPRKPRKTRKPPVIDLE